MRKAKPAPAPTREELKAADKVIRKMTGTNFPDKTKTALLPSVVDLFASDQEVQECVEILERGHALKDQMAEMDTELKGIKESATSIAIGAEVEGFRFGNLGVIVNLMAGRNSLNKDLLRTNMIEAGVDPTLVGQIIEDSHTVGEPYYTVKFEKVTK